MALRGHKGREECRLRSGVAEEFRDLERSNLPQFNTPGPAWRNWGEPRMRLATRIQLSAMMFLQFFIWGGWFVTMGSYLAANLGASGAQGAAAYSTQSWGAILAPFVVGLIADRYVNAERLLGAIHLVGAVLMYQLFRARLFDDFYPYLLGYMLRPSPTGVLKRSDVNT